MPNPTLQVASVPSNILAAAQDPAHSQHHFSLGQVLATVLLGASDAFAAYTHPADIPAAISSFESGFLQIWLAKPCEPKP